MDLSHLCGQDLAIDNTGEHRGDLATVTGLDEGQQRVLRRLLTSPTSYLWHLEYGAGLPAYLGQPAIIKTLQGVILNQMELEAAVMQSPPPSVTVQVDPTNTVTANIRYVDATTNLTSLLVIPVTG